MSDHTISVALTVDDVAFVRIAVKHYRIFAEASERQGDDVTAGEFRKQEFRGEQVYGRIEEAEPRLKGMP